jgi:hypothetical protein
LIDKGSGSSSGSACHVATVAKFGNPVGRGKQLVARCQGSAVASLGKSVGTATELAREVAAEPRAWLPIVFGASAARGTVVEHGDATPPKQRVGLM